MTHDWIQEQSNQTLLNQQKDLNQSVVFHIEKSIEQRKEGLELFAQQLSDGYRLRPTKVIQEKLDSRVGLHQYFNGGLLVLSGKAISIADSPAVKKRRGIDFSDRGHVKAVRHTGATIITRPRIGRGLKSPVFAINTPIKSESGEILGFILGVTKLKDNNFFKDISDESFGNYGSLFVIDPNLKLFVTASDKKLAMQKLPQTGENPVIDKVLAGSYSGFISDNKGGEVLFSAAKIDSMGFVVIHTLSEKVLSKKGWSLTFKFFSAFLALTLLVTLVIWVLLRNQLMVLRNTSDIIVEMVEEKRPYQALKVDQEDEIGSLILSFNKLQHRLSKNIDDLEESNEELEKRVEDRTKELLSSETQHRSLIENVIDGVITINNKGIIKSINPATERLFSYSAAELIGENIKMLMPDPYKSEHDGYLSNYRNTNVKKIIGIGREVKGLKKDGTIFPLDLGVSEMMLEGEQLFIGIIHDVSKRIEAENKINQSASQLNATLEATTDGILVVDDTGKIQTFNQVFIDLWRIPKEVIAKKTDEAAITFVLTQLENPDEFISKVESLYKTPKAESFDILNFKDGRVFERYSRPQKIGNQIIGRVWGFRDVSARVEAEHQLSDAKDNAEAANKAKSEFLSSMSHELRTPLNAVIGFSQLLELDKETLSKSQYSSVQDILEGGHHLLYLINEILELSKIESGKLECYIEKVSLKEIMIQCSKIINTLAEKSNIQIDYGNPENHMIMADSHRIKQVLINYLSNAIKYNRPNGHVTINYQPVENNRLRINVTDTGLGINESDLAILFQPFTRVGDKSANIEGTGIGLTISKELMTLMDGTVGVSSVVGEGTTFWLEIKLGE